MRDREDTEHARAVLPPPQRSLTGMHRRTAPTPTPTATAGSSRFSPCLKWPVLSLSLML